jgi:hypothetical protein
MMLPVMQHSRGKEGKLKAAEELYPAINWHLYWIFSACLAFLMPNSSGLMAKSI